MTRKNFAKLVAERVTSDWSWLQPILEDLIAALIEYCFQDEADFLATVTSPTAGLLRRLEARCWLALRGQRLGLVTRRVTANKMTTALIDVAWEQGEQDLRALYQEAA